MDRILRETDSIAEALRVLLVIAIPMLNARRRMEQSNVVVWAVGPEMVSHVRMLTSVLPCPATSKLIAQTQLGPLYAFVALDMKAMELVVLTVTNAYCIRVILMPFVQMLKEDLYVNARMALLEMVGFVRI